MDIIVCIKQVPDTSEVRINSNTKNLIREGVPSIINPNDKNGIEEALKLRKIHGGKITAISMGPQQSIEVLEYALGMGVDKAILLTDKALSGSDTLITGYVLSEIIKEIKFDLIICGLEALDGCTGQVGPIIAENLNIPQLTYVRKIKVRNNHIYVHKEMKQGYQILKTKLPALVSVLMRINKPKEPTKTNKKVKIKDVKDIGLDIKKIGIEGSPTRVTEIQMLERDKSYVSIDSSLSADDRIKAIINGGIATKKNINLMKGNPKELALKIFDYPVFQKFLEDD